MRPPAHNGKDSSAAAQSCSARIKLDLLCHGDLVHRYPSKIHPVKFETRCRNSTFRSRGWVGPRRMPARTFSEGKRARLCSKLLAMSIHLQKTISRFCGRLLRLTWSAEGNDKARNGEQLIEVVLTPGELATPAGRAGSRMLGATVAEAGSDGRLRRLRDRRRRFGDRGSH